MLFSTPTDSNSSRILSRIWMNGVISRRELAQVCALDESTVSRIVSGLIASGVVLNTSHGPSGPLGGRKPVNLIVNPQYGCVLGIEIQSESFTTVGINLAGDILFSTTGTHGGGNRSLSELFSHAMDESKESLSSSGLPLLGIGVGLPGIIDSRNGIILSSHPLEISEPQDFLGEVSRQVNVPLRIEHDARCCCMGELAFKKAQCPDDFIFVLGEFRRNSLVQREFKSLSLGLGLVFARRVHVGKDFAAGEFRSVFYQDTRRNELFNIPDGDLEMLEESSAVQGRFARELGANLALLVNVLNIGHVFVGGSIERLGQGFLDALRAEIVRNQTYPGHGNIDIKFADLGTKAVAYGAAGMFLENLFVPA